MPKVPFVVAALGLLVLGAGMVSGQDYPSKPIRIVVTAAGGGTDFTARIVAQGLSAALEQPVIVDNRGTGFIAAEVVSKAPPDGYSLHINGTSLWIVPLLRKTTYDPVRDFSPVSLIVREVTVLAVHPSVPVKSVRELVALAKARPGDLNYGSGAVGSLPHLSMELLKSMAGVNIVHVPLKGVSATITAVLSGEVQVIMNDVGFVMPHVKTGRLRTLAVTSAEPSAMTPGLPTVASSGVPGFEAVSMTGMFAPAKTPAAIVNRLSQETVRLLRTPAVKEKFLNQGAEVVGSTPEEFAGTLKSEIAKMGKVIKDAAIKLE